MGCSTTLVPTISFLNPEPTISLPLTFLWPPNQTTACSGKFDPNSPRQSIIICIFFIWKCLSTESWWVEGRGMGWETIYPLGRHEQHRDWRAGGGERVWGLWMIDSSCSPKLGQGQWSQWCVCFPTSSPGCVLPHTPQVMLVKAPSGFLCPAWCTGEEKAHIQCYTELSLIPGGAAQGPCFRSGSLSWMGKWKGKSWLMECLKRGRGQNYGDRETDWLIESFLR